jgi:hypothetical protein
MARKGNAMRHDGNEWIRPVLPLNAGAGSIS